MKIFIPASYDSTIYERYPQINTGLDEVLEIGKTIKPLDTANMHASGATRILIDFDIPSEQQYPSSSKYYLNLRIANATNVNRYQKLEVYPVSRSWTEGSGYFYQDVTNVEDGVSWEYATNTQRWAVSGSNYTTSISQSYVLSKTPIQDIKIDVTNLIAPVVSGSNTTQWNGLLLKYPTADELDSTNIGNIKLFSSNTHTIFAPKLEVAWNNQQFITGSLKPIRNSSVSILPKNLKEMYSVGEIDKVYLVVRDPYPDRKFDAVQRYKTTYYLPSSSYYRITDDVSGIVLYDFDQYSAISCDKSGSYFTIDTTGLEVGRYYTLDLKIQTDALVFFPKFNYTFKVDNNG
jgi:hypothetical protein